jgi:antitoxin ParD1/3/4
MSETVQANLEALRAVLIEGEQSGSGSPFDFEAFLARKRGSVAPARDAGAAG